MQGFYNPSIISEILKIFNVNHVVISGIKEEILINNILEYDATFTQINTNDNNCIKNNPLFTLPNLKNYDAIFIDDDSNWYTVFNELKIIKETNAEFPLVFICNCNFPNKRRDSYSNPEDIPVEFRQKFTNGLPVYYKDEKIIISDGFYHACDENTPKNGVLTAIEDFLDANLHIGLVKFNSIKEICVLYPKSAINQKRVSIIAKNIQYGNLDEINVSDKLIENQLLIQYINKYNLYNEKFNELEVEISEKDKIIHDYKNRIRIQDNKMDFKETQIDSFESKLSLKDSLIKNFESKLINKDRRIDDLKYQLNYANNELSSLTHEIEEKNIKINELYDEFTNIESNYKNQINTKQLESIEKDKKLKRLETSYIKQFSKIDNKNYCIRCFKDEISNNHFEIEYRKKNSFTKLILDPLSYLYLVFKSSPKDALLNIKLYRALKNSKCFDIGFYLNKNRDLLESKWCKYFSPELHYVCNGFNENRTFNKKYFNRNSKEDLLEYILTCNY